MADPLASVGRGQTSPFLTSAATVNTTLDLLRQYRHQQGRGFVGIGAQDDGPLGTSTRVIVRNDTQGAIVPGSIVKLSDRVTDFDGENGLMFVVQPIFKGITPAATTDRFAILEEGADYPGGGDYSYARAVIAGHAVCVVNITDTGHLYATPTAGDNTRLTSASSGPVLILAKMDAGTGNVDCSVLVTQVTPAAGSAAITTYVSNRITLSYNINVSSTLEDTGVHVTPTDSGDYLAHVTAFIFGQVSAFAPGQIELAIWDGTAGTQVGPYPGSAFGPIVFEIPVTGVPYRGTVHFTTKITAIGGNQLQLRILRGGSTWTNSGLGGTTFPSLSEVILEKLS